MSVGEPIDDSYWPKWPVAAACSAPGAVLFISLDKEVEPQLLHKGNDISTVFNECLYLHTLHGALTLKYEAEKMCWVLA